MTIIAIVSIVAVVLTQAVVAACLLKRERAKGEKTEKVIRTRV